MTCPACSSALDSITVNAVALDACKKGCGGVWFDKNELDRFETASESAGSELLKHLHPKMIPASTGAPRTCPKCVKYKMQKRFACAKRNVEVESCPGCGGIWLDTGELARIQENWQTDAERLRAFDAMVAQEVMPILAREQARVDANAAALGTIDAVLKFIRPSYYLTGK